MVEPAERADIAVLQYTGGTTGVPKAVMLSHRNLYANARQISLWFTKAELGAERIVAILPFTHSFGMTAVMNFALSLGGEMILLPRFEMGELLAAIERRRATMIMGVPSLFHAIERVPQTLPLRPLLAQDRRLGRRFLARCGAAAVRATDRLPTD